jgi:Spy/CpxP family protein refolding chaperone
MVKNRIALLSGAALALASITLLGSVAIAQAPPAAPGGQGQGRGQGRGQGGRGGRQASLTTMPIETLDKILKLTPDQKTKITAAREKYTADSRALRPQQGQQFDPANMTKLRELSTAANKQIEDTLTADQKKKWTDARKDITMLSSAGIPAGMYGELKLTDDQKKKLEAIQKDAATKAQGLQGQDRRAAMQEARTKAAEVLTADQKAAVEKYVKEHPRQGGPGGGANGGGRRRQQPPIL